MKTAATNIQYVDWESVGHFSNRTNNIFLKASIRNICCEMETSHIMIILFNWISFKCIISRSYFMIPCNAKIKTKEKNISSFMFQSWMRRKSLFSYQSCQLRAIHHDLFKVVLYVISFGLCVLICELPFHSVTKSMSKVICCGVTVTSSVRCCYIKLFMDFSLKIKGLC